MSLPFGLDFKSILVGIVFAFWVLPWIMSFFSRAKAQKTA